MVIFLVKGQKTKEDAGETKTKWEVKVMPKLIKVKIVVDEDGGYYLEEDRDDGLSGQKITHPADVIAVLENILAKHEATLPKEVVK